MTHNSRTWNPPSLDLNLIKNMWSAWKTDGHVHCNMCGIKNIMSWELSPTIVSSWAWTVRGSGALISAQEQQISHVEVATDWKSALCIPRPTTVPIRLWERKWCLIQSTVILGFFFSLFTVGKDGVRRMGTTPKYIQAPNSHIKYFIFYRLCIYSSKGCQEIWNRLLFFCKCQNYT